MTKPLLVDVREPGEFASERAPDSVNIPLSRLETGAASLPRDRPLSIVCQNGARAADAARRLSALGFSDVRIVEGGLAACGGLEKGPGGAWAMERQVRFGAGSLVLLGLALAWAFHPAFAVLSAFVGAGLVFSAATNTCGMAMLLARMPWNRG